MNEKESSLWKKVKSFMMDDPGSDFTFTDRLARENAWSMEYAVRAVLEYKKFMFLICVADHPLTPSDQVDQVWHLHLLYTESYWKSFCKETLGRSIQHGPTKGGSSEKSKYNNLYEATKELYKEKFKTDPPADLWPSNEIRFGNLHFTRVNRHQNWVIKKPLIFKKWTS